MSLPSPARAVASALIAVGLLCSGCSSTPPPAASASPSATPSGSGAPYGAPPAPPPAAAGVIRVHGTVRKIADDRHAFTVSHDDIPALSMKAMTMPFKVRSPKLLESIRPGSEVFFTIDPSSGEYLVVGVESVSH